MDHIAAICPTSCRPSTSYSVLDMINSSMISVSQVHHTIVPSLAPKLTTARMGAIIDSSNATKASGSESRAACNLPPPTYNLQPHFLPGLLSKLSLHGYPSHLSVCRVYMIMGHSPQWSKLAAWELISSKLPPMHCAMSSCSLSATSYLFWSLCESS